MGKLLKGTGGERASTAIACGKRSTFGRFMEKTLKLFSSLLSLGPETHKMPIENEYISRQEVPSDSYMGKAKYRISCKCLRCGSIYKKVVSRLTDDNPPCPKKACKAAIAEEARVKMERNLRAMIEAERGPGHIGANVTVKAIDTTAQIVQQDYGLTNLKDNIREGESMAPSLPPKMQQAADNFFKAPANVNPEQKNRRTKQIELLGRRAMAGAFRGMALDPGAVMPGKTGTSTLRKTGEEKIR